MRHDGKVHEPDVGQTFDGRYVVRERLGDGGTATVYRADDLQLDRSVAIKVYGPQSELSDNARRQREARALAGLRHPAIVTLFDARLDATPPYLVLEFVDGETLSRRIARGPLSAAETRLIGGAAANGLAAAHDAGLVHRDVKPANLVIPADPAHAEARLLDFGIAHAVGDSRATTHGSVVGSAVYVSPEQARGDDDVTPASDVYSLGLVLIECLTGRPAFSGSTQEVLAARLVRSPALDDPALAADAELLGRMTALDAADRPTAAEVAYALGLPAATRVLPSASATAPTERITDTVPPAPQTALPLAPVPARGPRRRVVAITLGSLGALVAVAVVAIMLALTPGLAPAPGPSESPPAESTPTDEVVATPTPTDDAPGNSGNAPGQKDKDDKSPKP